ncbi:electron transfer flavoprotein subunit beta/FixA family protein [Nesterenkonia jeotgali]|uniref:Electron transfer flavoprotein subunit beta n=1 Tax=Nesterenkonia jeotgali TaxID=317018 RepID=A0A839FUA1_9MICC|nr:electron transfer flavoprotein subunit beta/FixA family protein [Nesterenkonia jeotgali]MBA8922151.1 electron transfer flavoprotein beta subunit [Nesterenkonia jeotgali]
MVNAPLHIITLVKWVPDAQLERRYNAEARIDRSEGVLSELDEYPLEAALQLREAAQDREVRVTALTMGPAGSSTAVKKALQIGADDGYQLTDDALIGADIWATSVALKAAVEAVAGAAEFESGEPEYLVLTGMASEEGESGAVPAQLAERLGAHVVTYATGLELEPERLIVTRSGGTESQKVAVRMPAVVSVTDQANDPRYPNFKAIMAAKKKPLTRFSLADLGLRAEEVTAKVRVLSTQARPARTAGEIITDEGDAGLKIVEFLAKERLL